VDRRNLDFSVALAGDPKERCEARGGLRECGCDLSACPCHASDVPEIRLMHEPEILDLVVHSSEPGSAPYSDGFNPQRRLWFLVRLGPRLSPTGC
jgi:hypothetical protein